MSSTATVQQWVLCTGLVEHSPAGCICRREPVLRLLEGLPPLQHPQLPLLRPHPGWLSSGLADGAWEGGEGGE